MRLSGERGGDQQCHRNNGPAALGRGQCCELYRSGFLWQSVDAGERRQTNSHEMSDLIFIAILTVILVISLGLFAPEIAAFLRRWFG
jgi:hypothetical protein